MILISTPIRIKKSYNNKYLLLGKWCFKFCEQDVNPENVEFLDYHWNSYEKLESDYHYTFNLYKKFLPKVSSQLNTIHNVNYDEEYWKILIGPWLILFIQTIYDRWSSIKLAESSKKVSEAVISLNHKFKRANDTRSFREDLFTDKWNQSLFDYIICKCTNIKTLKVKEFDFLDGGNYKNGNEKLNHQFKTIEKVKKYIKKFFKFLNYFESENNSVFISTELGFKSEIILHYKVNLFPTYRSIQSPTILQNKSINISQEKFHGSAFEELLYDLVFKLMPFCYLEGYDNLHQEAEKLDLPQNPQLIWSTSNDDNELYKMWMAKKKMNGSKICIGQHGGGTWHKFNTAADLEFDNSDYFFSTGKNKNFFSNRQNYKHKIINFGQVYSSKNKYKYTKQGNLLIVGVEMPRYSFDIRSMAMSSNFEEYIFDQEKLIQSLNLNIQKNTMYRLYMDDFDWNIESRLKQTSQHIKTVRNVKVSFYKDLSKCRLAVSTYPATTYNELLANNIPLVCFWDNKRWLLESNAENMLNELKNVKIFHDNPYSAAEHINNIWNNVDDWWQDIKTQDVIKKFTALYGEKRKSLNFISNEIKKLKASNQIL